VITFFKRFLIVVILLYLLGYLGVVLFTNNPIKCYIKSLISPNQKYRYSKKIEVINFKKLDSILTKSPNTIFNFVSIYCRFSNNEIKSGLDFNKRFNKKIIYISLDNSPSINELNNIVINNSNISKIYIVDDKSLSGSVYNRKRKVFNKFAPFYKDFLVTPIQMHSDSVGKIKRITFGQEMNFSI
jgi:hypothetical protein